MAIRRLMMRACGPVDVHSRFDAALNYGCFLKYLKQARSLDSSAQHAITQQHCIVFILKSITICNGI
jgi:hypothetical protein